MTAEVFPWAIIYSLYVRRRIFKIEFLLLVYFLVAALAAIFYSYYVGIENDVIRSLLAYINPILIFITILNVKTKEADKLMGLVKGLFIFLTVLGVLQFLNLISWLRPVFDLLLTRGSTSSFGLGRGVSLLSSEPSRAAYEYLFVYFCYRCSLDTNKFKLFFLDLCVSIFVLIVIRSAMGAFFLIAFWGVIYNTRLFKYLVFVIPVIILVGFTKSDSRAIQILSSIFTQDSLESMGYLIMSASGFRLISQYAGFKYGFDHIWGGGVGLWRKTAQEALYNTGMDPSKLTYFVENYQGQFASVRPSTFMSSFMLDFGFIGVLILGLFFIWVLKEKVNYNMKFFMYFALFLFSIFFISDTGNPIPWICFAIIIRNLYCDKDTSGSLNLILQKN